MLYEIGHKSGLEINTVAKSDPFVVLAQGFTSLSVDKGRILVNGIDQGAVANAVPGAVVEIEAQSSGQYGVPTFVKFFQAGALEGVFTLINRIEETFVYDDRLNTMYAWETLPDSTWIPTDNGLVGIIDPADQVDGVTQPPQFTSLGPKELDLDSRSIYRNKIHVLDPHLDIVNVFDFQGNYVGRPELEYTTPADSATLYSELTASRILTVIAFETSNKVVLYTNEYKPLYEIDIVQPIAVATVLNTLYIAQRYTNDLLIVRFDSQGQEIGRETLTLLRRPHRLYLVEGRLAVLTQTSIEFVSYNFVEYSLSLPAFASSLAYDVTTQTLFVSHRQERRLSKIDLDIGGTSVVETKFFENQGYLDAIAFDRFTHTVWVSDVVTFQFLKLDTDLNQLEVIDLEGKHSYEMYVLPNTKKILFNALYPDIDARLIIGDANPDPQDFENIEGILPNQTGLSPVYSLTGVRDPVRLWLLPDDEDVVTRISTDEGTFVTGTTIGLGKNFQFEVSLPGGKSRKIDFVLGQEVYSFVASPDDQRRIPIDEIYEPVELAALETVVYSEVHVVEGLDVESVEISVTGGTLRTVEMIEEQVGETTRFVERYVDVGSTHSFSNGEQWQLVTTTGDQYDETTSIHVDYANVFQTTWTVTTTSESNPTENRPSMVDFVDVDNAYLDTEYLSVPSILRLEEDTVEASITSDYQATLIVNGEDRGTATTLENMDSVQIRLVTTNMYDTDHQVSLCMPKRSLTWNVKTIPPSPVVFMDFGFTDGVTLGDRVRSDSVVLDTVPAGKTIGIVVPRNTMLYVNGTQYIAGSAANYRNVVRVPMLTYVPGQSEIYLEGYANGVYGSVTQHQIRAGVSRGYWSIRSINTGDAIAYPNTDVLVNASPTCFKYDQQAIPYFDSDSSSDVEHSVEHWQSVLDFQANSTHPSAKGVLGNIEVALAANLNASGFSEDIQCCLVEIGSAYPTTNRVDVVPSPIIGWNKYTSAYVELDARTPVRSLPHRMLPTDKGDFLKSASGIKVSPVRLSYYRGKFPSHLVEDRTVFRQPSVPTIEVNLEYQRHENSQTSDIDLEYNRSPSFHVNSITLQYERPEPPATVEFEPVYSRSSTPDITETFLEYYRDMSFEDIKMDIKYNKDRSFEVVSINLEYDKPDSSTHANYTPFYQKSSTPDVNRYDVTYSKQLGAMIALTPIWTDVVIDFNEISGPKVLDNTVNLLLEETSFHIVESYYNLTVDTTSSTAQVGARDADVDTSYAHYVIQNDLLVLQPIDTFNIQVLGWPGAVVTENDCVEAGYTSCHEIGYFATEQEAYDDAVNVWQVPPEWVRTFETDPGCWFWSQKLPCANSCFGCPPSGYRHGG